MARFKATSEGNIPFTAQEELEADQIEALANSLDTKKAQKLQTLKDKFNTIASIKPRVTTGLGYDVDGGRDNKDDFFSKWEAMGVDDVTTVRDADNGFHTGITKAQMQMIYRAIVANGEALLTAKWAKEIEIANCTTVDALNLVVI